MYEKGEITVRAASNPPTERFVVPTPLAVELEEIDLLTAIECGFRVSWLEGKVGDRITVELCAGAGCGSPWLTVDVKTGDDDRRAFRIDARKIVEAVLEHATATRPVEGRGDLTAQAAPV